MKRQILIIEASSTKGKKQLARIEANRQRRDKNAGAMVDSILQAIKDKGDSALFAYTKKFDGMTLTKKNVRISQMEIVTQAKKVDAKLAKALSQAADRIRRFHSKQKPQSISMTTGEGKLSLVARPLNRVAVYVPGGHTVYPSTILMNVIPAQIAGVSEIVVATPPHTTLNPLIAFGLQLLGVKEVYRIGGAQAIGALAYGTQSIPAVDKIVGPGNLYVALAKKAVYGTVDIDAIAGPSEVVVLVDKTANPCWTALDLLAQAEHGSGDEVALCVTENMQVAQAVAKETAHAIEVSPRKNILKKLPPEAIAIVVTENRTQSIDLINRIAPEHLQIMTKTASDDVKKIKNAGAVFVGDYSPVALGDYYIGTNHVLPTGGTARFASPLGTYSFTKWMSVAQVSKAGLKKSAANVSAIAREENFVHHAMSVEKRT